MPLDHPAAPPDTEVPDIVGPGRTEQSVRPTSPPTGRRISRRAKGVGLGAGAAVIGALMVGVLRAGHPRDTQDAHRRTAADQGASVGQVPPPAPPPERVAAATVGAGASAPSGLLHEGSTQATLGAGGLAGLPDAAAQAGRKYQTWRVHQYYRVLQGRVLAVQAALHAPITPGGTLLSPGPALAGVGPGAPSIPAVAGTAGAAFPGGASESRAPGPAANQRFLADQARRRAAPGYLDQTLTPPAAHSELFAGSVIPAVLLTGIDSDLPGAVVAQVRQNVDNSLDPAQVLIPQGARLIGRYSSQVAYGQHRVLVAWRRIIFPDGATIALQGMPGADSLGRAGFHDQVDNHVLRIFGSAFLISTLGAGAQLAQPQNAGALNTPSGGQQTAADLANAMNSVGADLLHQNLRIQPTLKIRPGYLFNVLVTHTILLPPVAR